MNFNHSYVQSYLQSGVKRASENMKNYKERLDKGFIKGPLHFVSDIEWVMESMLQEAIKQAAFSAALEVLEENPEGFVAYIERVEAEIIRMVSSPLRTTSVMAPLSKELNMAVQADMVRDIKQFFEKIE